MPENLLRLRDNLDGFEVVLDDSRQVVRVTSGGRTMVCRQTQFGLICEPVGPSGSGGGIGPVLQLRVTPKRVFARSVPLEASDSERATLKGFQRHSF